MTPIVESSLQLEPDAVALRALGGWLRDATARLPDDVAASLLGRAELAVHEACMNVVDHARLPEGAVLDLHLVLTTTGLTVRITDPGEEFLMSAVVAPEPRTLQERGYGVKIIRSLVSDLTYERVDSRNVLSLRIDLDQHR